MNMASSLVKDLVDGTKVLDESNLEQAAYDMLELLSWISSLIHTSVESSDPLVNLWNSNTQALLSLILTGKIPKSTIAPYNGPSLKRVLDAYKTAPEWVREIVSDQVEVWKINKTARPEGEVWASDSEQLPAYIPEDWKKLTTIT
jgi:hypothetical protein